MFASACRNHENRRGLGETLQPEGTVHGLNYFSPLARKAERTAAEVKT